MKKSFLCIMLFLLSAFTLVGCGKKDKTSDLEKQDIYYIALDNYGYEGTFEEWQTVIKNAGKLHKKNIQLRIASSTDGDRLQWSFVGADSWKDIYSVEDITGFYRETFTIKFDFNAEQVAGQEVKIPDQKILEGDKIKKPKDNDVVRENYKLDGWKDSETNKKWNFEKDLVYSDMTLKAIWKKNQNKVTIKLNEGNGNSNPIMVDFDEQLKESMMPKVEREGYTFAGWRDPAKKEIVTFPLEIEENITLEAIWQKQRGNYIVEESGEGENITLKLLKYLDNEVDVVFPETIDDLKVVAIGSNIFGEKKDQIKSVVLSDTITSVDSEAFLGCKNLVSVDFKNAVNFGTSIFTTSSSKDKLNLQTITIKNATKVIDFFGGVENQVPRTFKEINVTYDEKINSLLKDVLLYNLPNTSFELNLVGDWKVLKENEFAGTKLSKITIPASVETIENKVFNECKGLNEIVVDEANKVYDSRNNSNAIIKTSENKLIAGCQNTNIPASVTSIGEFAFFDCFDLKKITIPTSITEIGEGAFTNCVNLRTIEIPSNVNKIGDKAFYHCLKLESVKLPEGLTTIGNEVFKNCELLTTVNIPESVKSIGYYAFYKCAALETIVLPKGLETIEYSAFKDCSNLKEVTIYENIKTVGFSAFRNCSSLTNITVKVKNPTVEVKDGIYFINGTNTNIAKETEELELTISSKETWLIDNTDTNVKLYPDWNINWNYDKVKVTWDVLK